MSNSITLGAFYTENKIAICIITTVINDLFKTFMES